MYNVIIKGDMQMTVYLDTLFVVNLAAECAVNYASYVLLDRKPKILRIFSAGTVSAVISVFGVVFPAFAKLNYIFSILVLLILFGKCDIKEFLKNTAAYCICAVCAFGVCRLFYSYTDFAVKLNGKVFFPSKDLEIFISFLIFTYSAKLIKAVFKYKNNFYTVKLTAKGRHTYAKAFLDTGNTLTYNEQPVIAVSEEIFDKLGLIPDTDIYYKTVSGETNIMKASIIDEIYFCDEKSGFKNIYAGINKSTKFEILLQNTIHP